MKHRDAADIVKAAQAAIAWTRETLQAYCRGQLLADHFHADALEGIRGPRAWLRRLLFRPVPRGIAAQLVELRREAMSLAGAAGLAEASAARARLIREGWNSVRSLLSPETHRAPAIHALHRDVAAVHGLLSISKGTIARHWAERLTASLEGRRRPGETPERVVQGYLADKAERLAGKVELQLAELDIAVQARKRAEPRMVAAELTWLRPADPQPALDELCAAAKDAERGGWFRMALDRWNALDDRATLLAGQVRATWQRLDAGAGEIAVVVAALDASGLGGRRQELTREGQMLSDRLHGLRSAPCPDYLKEANRASNLAHQYVRRARRWLLERRAWAVMVRDLQWLAEHGQAEAAEAARSQAAQVVKALAESSEPDWRAATRAWPVVTPKEPRARTAAVRGPRP